MMRRRFPGLLVLLLAGCGEPAALKTEYLGKVVAEAPPGMVRVVARKVPADEYTAHWKWSLRGDRVWPHSEVLMTEGGRTIHLSQAYPMTTRDRTGGSGAWEIDLGIITADPDKVSMGVKYMLGINPIGLKRSAPGFESQTGENVGMSQSGTLAGAARTAEPDALITPLLEGDQTLKLPIDAPLVRVEWTDPDGSKQSHTIRLKIDE